MSSVAEEADVRAVTALLAIRCMPPCVGCDDNNHGIGCVSCNGLWRKRDCGVSCLLVWSCGGVAVVVTVTVIVYCLFAYVETLRVVSQTPHFHAQTVSECRTTFLRPKFMHAGICFGLSFERFPAVLKGFLQ